MMEVKGQLPSTIIKFKELTSGVQNQPIIEGAEKGGGIVGDLFHFIYFTGQQLVVNNYLDVKENESERCELYYGIILFMLAALGIIGFLDSWVDGCYTKLQLSW